jgi:hypothetical protein
VYVSMYVSMYVLAIDCFVDWSVRGPSMGQEQTIGCTYCGAQSVDAYG